MKTLTVSVPDISLLSLTSLPSSLIAYAQDQAGLDQADIASVKVHRDERERCWVVFFDLRPAKPSETVTTRSLRL